MSIIPVPTWISNSELEHEVGTFGIYSDSHSYVEVANILVVCDVSNCWMKLFEVGCDHQIGCVTLDYVSKFSNCRKSCCWIWNGRTSSWVRCLHGRCVLSSKASVSHRIVTSGRLSVSGKIY